MQNCEFSRQLSSHVESSVADTNIFGFVFHITLLSCP